MVFREIKFNENLHEFKINEPVEGVLTAIEPNVGKYKSTLYTVGGKTFWGSAALDIVMKTAVIGKKYRITLVDDKSKFPSGQTGKNFRVEVEE